MKMVLWCIFWSVSTTVPGLTPSRVEPPFTVTITADHPTPKVGEPVMIHIALQSVSRKQITIPQERHVGTRGEFNYRITVVHVDGSAVPDTAEGIMLKNGTYAGEFSEIVNQLQFGETIKEDADLNNVVEITSGGYYAVQVERTLGLRVGSGIRSNKLIIRVK